MEEKKLYRASIDKKICGVCGGIAQGLQGGVEVVWHQDEVAAGLDGQQGCLAGCIVRRDGAHVVRICDDDAVIAQLRAQQVRARLADAREELDIVVEWLAHVVVFRSLRRCGGKSAPVV